MVSINDRSSTERKLKLYGIDVFTAFCSALAVAPFIKIIDMVVTKKAKNSELNLYKAAFHEIKSFATSPIQFIKQPTFIAVWCVYGGTYVAANCILTYCELNGLDSFYYKLFGSTAANMTLGITKDRYFAKVFGGNAPPKFPLSSWTIFMFRDLMTIGAGFTFPAIVSDAIIKRGWMTDKSRSDKVTQLLVPVIAQMGLTPVHLLSLDLYYRAKETVRSRFGYIKGIYVETVSMRMARVLCAYGIAGVTNTFLRTELRRNV